MSLHTVSSHTTVVEASMLKGRLQAEGIHAYLQGEHHVSANWMISQAIGGVRVQVVADDVDAAKAVVKAWYDGDYEMSEAELRDSAQSLLTPPLPTDVSASSVQCPACGSDEITLIERALSEKAVLTLMMLTLLPLLLFNSDNAECRQCQHRWVEYEYSLSSRLLVYVFLGLVMACILSVIYLSASLLISR